MCYVRYSVTKGSEADKALDEFFIFREAALKAIYAWTRKHGSRSKKLWTIDRRLAGVVFSKGRQPEGWIHDEYGYWRPHSSKNRAAYKEFNALPSIPGKDKITTAIGLEPDLVNTGGGFQLLEAGLEEFGCKRIITSFRALGRPKVKGLRPISESTYLKHKESHDATDKA